MRTIDNLIRPHAALFCLYWHSLHYALRQRAFFMLLCVMGLIFLTLDYESIGIISSHEEGLLAFRNINES